MAAADVQEFSMRSRVAARTSSDDKTRQSPTTSFSSKNRNLRYYRVQPADTINKLALRFSVEVGELRRVNNLVGIQDIVERDVVKIPWSAMRDASCQEFEQHFLDDEAAYAYDQERYIRRVPLHSPEDSRDQSPDDFIRNIDEKTALVKESLPEEGGVPGSFHFVDARPPDSGCSIWMLLVGVVVIFMVVPLLLTLWEEEQQAMEQSGDT